MVTVVNIQRVRTTAKQSGRPQRDFGSLCLNYLINNFIFIISLLYTWTSPGNNNRHELPPQCRIKSGVASPRSILYSDSRHTSFSGKSKKDVKFSSKSARVLTFSQRLWMVVKTSRVNSSDVARSSRYPPIRVSSLVIELRESEQIEIEPD